jgi:hypothetical protein
MHSLQTIIKINGPINSCSSKARLAALLIARDVDAVPVVDQVSYDVPVWNKGVVDLASDKTGL